MHTDHRLAQGEAYFQEGRIADAEEVFREILNESPDNADAWNNLAVIASRKGHGEIAYEHVSRALALHPAHQHAQGNFQEVCDFLGIPGATRRLTSVHPQGDSANNRLGPSPLRIALCCIPGDDVRLDEVVSYFRQNHQVRSCIETEGDRIADAVSWANVVWLEGATQMAENLTRNAGLLRGKIVVCRVLGGDIFSESLTHINWRAIHHLVAINTHQRELVLERVPQLRTTQTPIHVIPHSVDCRRIPPRTVSPGKSLAYVGDCIFHQGPQLLLQTFAELHKIDPEYELHIAGRLFDDRYPLYFTQMAAELNLRDRIHFTSPPADLTEWLQDKHYIISSSLTATDVRPILVAMAYGIKPVIHNFVGARGIFDATYLWNTIPEFIKQMTSEEYHSAEYRTFVDWHYGTSFIQFKLDKLAGLWETALGTLSPGRQEHATRTTESALSAGVH